MNAIKNPRTLASQPRATLRTGLGLLLLVPTLLGVSVMGACDAPLSVAELEGVRGEDEECCDDSCGAPNAITTVDQLKECAVVKFEADPENPGSDAADGDYEESNERPGHWNHPQKSHSEHYYIELGKDDSAKLYLSERGNKKGPSAEWTLDNEVWSDGSGFPASATCTRWYEQGPHRNLEEDFCGNGVVDGDELCDNSAPFDENICSQDHHLFCPDSCDFDDPDVTDNDVCGPAIDCSVCHETCTFFCLNIGCCHPSDSGG